MENLNEIINELKEVIVEAKEKLASEKKKKKKPSNSNDDKGRTQGRVIGTFLAPQLENSRYELQLPYSEINQTAEVTLRNIPCGNDPRIFLDQLENKIFPIIEIPKENISLKLVYERLNRH